MEWWRHSRLSGTRAARLAGFGVLAVALSLVADSFLLPLAVRGFVRVIELLMNACVWLALSLGVGMNAWSVLGVIGRAAAGMVMTRQASAALTVVMTVGVLAAYGLQRMLGFPQDTGKAASPGPLAHNRTKEESPR